MNIYHLQKINRIIKSEFVKNSVVWLFHVLNKPYLAIYFDPILACNLRCRSCYFSNDTKRKELKGSFSQSDLSPIATAVFKRALRLQIGCGAEPTLFKHNAELIRLGKEYGIRYISLTTNANLLTEVSIKELLEAGLDEMTISLHGVTKETYEYLMTNASFDKLKEVMQLLSDAKSQYPNFKLRLNYTVNNFNIDELSHFFDVFGVFSIDILQLRALRDIGGDIRSVETHDSFILLLNQTLQSLKSQCKKRGISFIGPDSFSKVEDDNKADTIENASYCYISPTSFWRTDFNWRNETFNQYSKRTRYASVLFKSIISKKRKSVN